MTAATPVRRVTLLTGVLLVAGILVAGCGSSSGGGSDGNVTSVMTKAKKQFDETSSVHFTMSTKAAPTTGNAVLGADGTLTHQPGFTGSVKVLLSGFNADVPIVAVNGKVYAKLPLTTSYAPINPSEYGAPDPADFADRDKGISGLLLKMDNLKKAGETRNGADVLTTYSGTLTGDLVAPIIPSANPTGSYATVVGIDPQGRIATLKVTGDFFTGSGPVTYDLSFDSYGKSVTITAP